MGKTTGPSHLRQHITMLALIGASLLGLQARAEAADKVMVILQENSGKLDVLPPDTPPAIRDKFFGVIDAIAETFEDIKSDLQGGSRYQKVIHLTDENCTRKRLLETLVRETLLGNEIDLFVFGHGGPETLLLHGDEVITGGTNGTIRSLLTEARSQRGPTFNFNLRLVYMCNCYGSTVNDDWRAIGAEVSVGSACINYMAEPMITLFIQKFVLENKTVAESAAESFNEASWFWAVAGIFAGFDVPPDVEYGCQKGANKFQTSRPLVAGNGSIRFSPFTPGRGVFRGIGDVLGTTVDDQLTEGTYYLQSAASSSGKYLDMSYSCKDETFCKVQLWELGQTTSNNRWRLKKIDGILGGYTLQVATNNRYLDADAWTIGDNGTKVQVAPRLPAGTVRTNQEWKILKRSDGNYTLKNIFSGRYLDVVNNCVNSNGCGVQLWDDYGHITRRWKLVRAD